MMDINTEPKLFETKVYQPLPASFAKITDLRCKRGVRYKLQPFLILLFLSKLGGADRPAEIADRVKFRFTKLKSLLNLEWKKSPHETLLETDYGKCDQGGRGGKSFWRVSAFDERR